MTIQTRPSDRPDGGTNFLGPCGSACFAVNTEGEFVEDCHHYEVRGGTEICKKDEC